MHLLMVRLWHPTRRFWHETGVAEDTAAGGAKSFTWSQGSCGDPAQVAGPPPQWRLSLLRPMAAQAARLGQSATRWRRSWATGPQCGQCRPVTASIAQGTSVRQCPLAHGFASAPCCCRGDLMFSGWLDRTTSIRTVAKLSDDERQWPDAATTVRPTTRAARMGAVRGHPGRRAQQRRRVHL